MSVSAWAREGAVGLGGDGAAAAGAGSSINLDSGGAALRLANPYVWKLLAACGTNPFPLFNPVMSWLRWLCRCAATVLDHAIMLLCAPVCVRPCRPPFFQACASRLHDSPNDPAGTGPSER